MKKLLFIILSTILLCSCGEKEEVNPEKLSVTQTERDTVAILNFVGNPDVNESGIPNRVYFDIRVTSPDIDTTYSSMYDNYTFGDSIQIILPLSKIPSNETIYVKAIISFIYVDPLTTSITREHIFEDVSHSIEFIEKDNYIIPTFGEFNVSFE